MAQAERFGGHAIVFAPLLGLAIGVRRSPVAGHRSQHRLAAGRLSLPSLRHQAKASTGHDRALPRYPDLSGGEACSSDVLHALDF